MIIVKRTIKIVATILAKNEEDIIGRTIEHHLSHGVTQIIFTDNASSDRTREIAANYPEVVEIIDEPGNDHRQSEWVTRMARLACKLFPDWIVHLDADELWCGLSQLRSLDCAAIGSTKMYLHPPTGGALDSMRHYLDFDSIPGYVGECKVAHRPNRDYVISHGNHGIVGQTATQTGDIWRHHYPIRSYEQFARKAVEGHKSLTRRNAICERWQKWNDLHDQGILANLYQSVCDTWQEMKKRPDTKSLVSLMEFWSTPATIELFRSSGYLPTIGEWPRLHPFVPTEFAQP